MATAKRFSYSLLISTLVFTGFAVLAFSGLFPWVEAQFYSPKVISDLDRRLEQAQTSYEEWKVGSVGKLDKLLADGSFQAVYSQTASRDALQGRYQAAKLFLLGVRGGGSLRILSADLTQVHFSTEDSDVKVRGDFALTYRPFAELTAMPDLKTAGLTDGRSHVVADPAGRMVYFLHPWMDTTARTPGYALLGLSLEDWRLDLAEGPTGLGESSLVALGQEQYLFSLLGRPADASVVTRVKELQRQGIVPPVQRLAQTGELSVSLVHRGGLSLLIPSSLLELNALLKGLILVSLFTVVFLITFLAANLRGEPLSVVTRKVKRFQLQVVRQYLDLKEQDRIQSLRDELAAHSSEIRADVRRSLGRVRRRDQEWVDRYIDTSWQEVMDLLRGPSPPAEPSSNADWKRLETLLQQALTQGRFVVSPPPSSVVNRPMPSEASADEAEELEELDDLEEVEEVDEVLDELEAGDPEDLETLEPDEDPEAEEIEELEAEDAEELLAEEEEFLEELEGGDMESNDGNEPADVDDLVPLDAHASMFHARGPGPVDGELTMLPAFPEEGDVEELEELEDAPDAEALPVGEDFSYPLERLDAVWGTIPGDVFEDSDDVVTLRDEVFSDIPAAEDLFGQLVDQVLAGPEGSGFVPLDREDLVPQHQSREWRWTGGGFDWDRFALGNDEVNLFRALSEIVTELDAFTAAILTEESDRWSVQSSVGFSDAGKAVLNFGPESSLYRQFLSIRALHSLQGGTAHPVLAESFHSKDLKFLKAVLCVPLLFRHQPAWLLLGLRRQPEDLLNLLAPRRVG